VLQPLVILAATVVAQMLLVAFRRDHRTTLALGLFGMAGALTALLVTRPALWTTTTDLLSLDGYALFFAVLVVLAAMVVTALSYHELEGRVAQPEEYYILLSLAVLGGVVLVAANHFATFFLGLELLSVSLYALIAYPRSRDRRALEAGMKYLILAGASSGFILFGMALVYAQVGSLALPTLSAALWASTPAILTVAGVALMVVGIGFKLGLVPFHFWTPDVYEGAPTPIAAFLATASKGAVLALLLRHFAPGGRPLASALMAGVSVLAIASMLGGNLLALLQDNVKRILGGSSIAHMGYAMVAFVAGGRLAGTALAFYLLSYFITMLGAFGVVSLLSAEGSRADRIEDYRGLARTRPWLAAALTAMLLSLAGIPLTAGFVGKFYVAAAGANSALWALLGALVIGSVIGLFYYLRIIIAIYSGLEQEPGIEAEPLPAARPIPLVGGVLLSALTLLLVWLGVFPAPILRLIEAAAQRF
jgi:NADH-quinone oxidoreductase subunit N